MSKKINKSKNFFTTGILYDINPLRCVSTNLLNGNIKKDHIEFNTKKPKCCIAPREIVETDLTQ